MPHRANKGITVCHSSRKRITKYREFKWTQESQTAFEKLKKTFIKALILAYYSHILETWIEIDSSNFVVVGILSQMDNSILKQVVYFS